jgi:DNA polymerase III epsilon subunit-like protein
MFKLSNDIIVIDLEATAGTDKDGHQTNDFIIDIGAVLLDKDLEIIGSFSETVRPEESISPFIAELTGISDDMVAQRPLWSKVGEDFQQWVRQRSGNPKKARLAAWGITSTFPSSANLTSAIRCPILFQELPSMLRP